MKRLYNKKVKSVLRKAKQEWKDKGKPIPGDGYLLGVYWQYGTPTDKIDKYQVDIINDSRFYKNPRFNVYMFKPHSNTADYIWPLEVRGKSHKLYKVKYQKRDRINVPKSTRI